MLDENSAKEPSHDLKSQENVETSSAHKSDRVESEVDGPKKGIIYMKDSLLEELVKIHALTLI